MTTVNVSATETDPTHDVSISDGSTTYGLIYAGGPRVLQEIPFSPPAQSFQVEQKNWVGGRGRPRYKDDPTGFFDSLSMWTTADGKIFPFLQWRFASGMRADVDEDLPGDNESMAWWQLYGDTAASRIARYLSRSFTASNSVAADKTYLWIRRRGTPGTLTFELCANSSGDPGTVLQTVTKTTSNITDTISLYTLFDWSGTEGRTATTVYHLKVYGASTDDADDHWEILVDSAGSGKYSAAGSVWSATSIGALFYRITGTDTGRTWYLFNLEGGTYACSKYNGSTASELLLNGERGTATAATSTSLTCSALSMTTDQYADGYTYIRIIDGTGDGQVRLITANTGTAFTVDTWDETPSTDSRFVVYSTKYWKAVTGTHGLGKVVSQPIVASKVAMFPQGQSVNTRRMQVSASTHNFAADGTNKADFLYPNVDAAGGELIYSANAASSSIASAAPAGYANHTYVTAKNVGMSDYRITNLYNYNNILHVFKEDGPYSFDGLRVKRVGVNFSDVPDVANGLAVKAQDKYLWWSWAHSAIRTLGTDSTDMLNWRQGYEGLPSNRTGVMSAIVSAVGWMFFVIDGVRDNYSSVICWNGFGWHEVFRSWEINANKYARIRSIYWQPNEQARGRLWIEVSGELVFIEFPKFSANPLRDSTLNYMHEGVFVTSTVDGGDPLLPKVLKNLKLLLDQGSVEVDYQTNANVDTSTWTVLSTASTSPVSDLTLNLGAVYQIRFRLRFQVTASRTPAVLSGWMTEGRMMPPPKYQYVGQYVFSTDSQTKTNEDDHAPNTVYSQLQTWAQNQTKLTLRTQSASSDNKNVTISLPAKTLDWINPDETEFGGRIQFVVLEI